jgi:hypothetical protein
MKVTRRQLRHIIKEELEFIGEAKKIVVMPADKKKLDMSVLSDLTSQFGRASRYVDVSQGKATFKVNNSGPIKPWPDVPGSDKVSLVANFKHVKAMIPKGIDIIIVYSDS